MRSKNYKLHKRGTRLLVYAVVSVISLILLLFAVGESVKAGTAAPITTIPNNTTKINETSSNNPMNEITSAAKSTNTNSSDSQQKSNIPSNWRDIRCNEIKICRLSSGGRINL